MLSWAVQLLVAFLLGQTLFLEFTGAPESVALFEALGAEPLGRFGTGAAELAAVILWLVPRTAALGGLLSMVLMTGAIGAHLFRLGVVWQDDGGLRVPAALRVAGPAARRLSSLKAARMRTQSRGTSRSRSSVGPQRSAKSARRNSGSSS